MVLDKVIEIKKTVTSFKRPKTKILDLCEARIKREVKNHNEPDGETLIINRKIIQSVTVE